MTKEMRDLLVDQLDAAKTHEVEEWRPIDGLCGRYLVSSCGRVLALPNCQHNAPIFKKQTKNRLGYMRISLTVAKRKQKMFSVHRLVAEAFIPNPKGFQQVNHIDEDKTNNHITNLEWVTASQNCNHGTRKERIRSKQLNNIHPRAVVQKTLDGEVVAVYPSGREVERASARKFKRTGIVECLRGRCKNAYGFIWEYADGKGVY